MVITRTSSDEVVLRVVGERLARLRLERNLTQAQLAREAGLAQRTVTRIEAGGPATLASLVRILRALNVIDSLNQFLPPPVPSPIEALERWGKQRRRASGPRKRRDKTSPGDAH